MGIQYEIKARVKSPYSIWNKMRNKHVTFDEIYDILAVRIICTPREGEDEINECFQIYVAVSKLYKAHPDRLRDWLNHPKANGYQALHVTLMSLLGRWIEVQIRSKHMDEIAEQGFAAHWKYKAGANTPDDERDKELNDWLRTIKEILDDPQPDAMDFLDTIKLNLFASEIFVFTPKGEIVTMPADCTALDFAYNIHTFVGSHCIGAKVNHKLVPLSHKLQSGDQVEILTSKAQHVQQEWINFVFTAKAKGKIQAQLRRDEKVVRSAGEEMLRQWFLEHDTEMTTSLVDKLCDLLEVHKHEQLYLGIGRKSFTLDDELYKKLTSRKKKAVDIAGWRKFVPFIKTDKKKTVKQEEKFIVTDKFDKKKPIYLTEGTIGKYIFPDCCHAIPGDDILGYIDDKNRIKIHRRDCPVAVRLKSSYGNRIVDAKWKMHNLMFFDAGISAKGIDRVGLLKDVTQILSDELKLNIKNVNIHCENELFEAHFDIRVHNRDEVQDIIKKLRAVQGIEEISMD